MMPAETVSAALPVRILGQLRSGAWLDRERVLAYGGLLLLLEIVALIAIALGTYGVYVTLEAPSSTDFISFYAAGRLADLGLPDLAYDPMSHWLMERQVFGDMRLPYAYYFFYPPVFMMICAAFALLPYLLAFAMWIAVTAGLFVAGLRSILRDWRLVLAFFSFPAAFVTIGIGQNSFLTAGLLGLATKWVDRRPLAAGFLFGALIYKPHFLMMVPVALLAGRRWSALLGTIVSVAGFLLLSLLWFGWETWRVYLIYAQSAADSFSSGRIGYAGLVSLFAAARLLGGGVWLAYGIQGAAILLAALLTAFVWWRDASQPVRAMVLIAATLISPPVILFYDLLPAAVAIAWLLLDTRRTGGFLPWEKTVLAAIWLVPILSRGVGIAWGLPLGPIATIGLLALAMRRAGHELRGPAATTV